MDPGPDAGLELGLDHGFTQFSGDKNAVVDISKQAHVGAAQHVQKENLKCPKLDLHSFPAIQMKS